MSVSGVPSSAFEVRKMGRQLLHIARMKMLVVMILPRMFLGTSMVIVGSCNLQTCTCY